MHVYAQYASEFVMGNNTVAPFHLINFLVRVRLPSLPEAVWKLKMGGAGFMSVERFSFSCYR